MPNEAGLSQPSGRHDAEDLCVTASSHAPYHQEDLVRVREALESMLPLGDATLISVARHLQVNKDRLKRTLYEHGWTYSRLRMHVQFQLSTHLLIRSDASIDEICERTGFSEISCFYRAFRRWTGDSPGAYRARMR